MRLLYIIGETVLTFPASIKNSFQKLGYDVIECAETNVEDGYTEEQVQKIIDAEYNRYIDILKNNKIDFVFVVNARSLKREFFEFCRVNKIPLYQYLVDSIKWHPKYLEDMKYYDDIFSYEPTDEEIEFRPGKFVKFLPIGCDTDIYKPSADGQYKYDLFFVGNLDIRRWNILEQIAKNARQKGYRMVVYTDMQIKKITAIRHTFKILSRKIRYTLRYPNLMKVVKEEVHIGTDLADLYSASKICLNIHSGENKGMHTGPNLRAFEIMGCKSFELIDEGHLIGTQYVSGEDIVEAADSEWNTKIDYYLAHDEEREKIAENGYRKTCEYHTMDCLVKRILEHIAVGK